MFDIGFTKKDVVRSAWAFAAVFVVTFLAGVSGVAKDLITSCQAGACDVASAKAAVLALVLAAGTAAVVAVKNLFLADGSLAKG